MIGMGAFAVVVIEGFKPVEQAISAMMKPSLVE